MMRMTKNWMMIGALMATATQAFASDSGEAPNPFAGDLGNAVWTLVIFLIVVVLLGKFLWGPILKGLQSRENFIATALREADDASKKAQAQLAEYSQKLDQARAEATAIVEEGRRDAEVTKRAIHEEARNEADKMIERAKREIGIARDSAVRELCDLGAKLATDAASKIVGRELSQADHERLIRESIDEISAQNASRN